jgi:hypothetical protein
MNVPYNFPYLVARRTLDLLINHKVMRRQGVVFYVWQRDDRLILAFDTTAVVLDKLNERFAHELSTILRGRRVIRTNSRGIFLQVGFEIPPAPILLDEKVSLDLSKQPSPWHLPIGMTKDGPMWISLMDADSLLVGGTRRMGKSGFTHGLIQALLHGERTQIYAWDGKGGLEYQGYVGNAKFHFISNATRGLLEVRQILEQRKSLLQASGYNSAAQHNAAGQEFIEPIALIVDEIALLDDATKRDLKQMVELYGALGLYPVLATNNPTQAAILVKANLATRICFAVPSFTESLTVLASKGAETLPKGQGLIAWDARLIEFRPFHVSYPEPTEEQRRRVAELNRAQSGSVAAETADPIQELAESIREQWSPEMSKRAVGRLLGMEYAGSYARKIDQVIAYLSATTTPENPVSGENDPETGE